MFIFWGAPILICQYSKVAFIVGSLICTPSHPILAGIKPAETTPMNPDGHRSVPLLMMYQVGVF